MIKPKMRQCRVGFEIVYFCHGDDRGGYGKTQCEAYTNWRACKPTPGAIWLAPGRAPTVDDVIARLAELNISWGDVTDIWSAPTDTVRRVEHVQRLVV